MFEDLRTFRSIHWIGRLRKNGTKFRFQMLQLLLCKLLIFTNVLISIVTSS
jgi:hypothetical protein